MLPPSHAGRPDPSVSPRRQTLRLANAVTRRFQRLSVSLSHRHTCAPELLEGPGSLFPAAGMDFLARALDCGMLGWASIRALSSNYLGMEVGSWTVVWAMRPRPPS